MLISILACSRGFHTIIFERSTSVQIAIFKIKPVWLVSLFGHLAVRSGRIRRNRQTEGRTERMTDQVL